MKIRINRGKCDGHHRCYSGYPELFGMDDNGDTMVLDHGIVPEDLREDARFAAEECPESAIVIIETDS